MNSSQFILDKSESYFINQNTQEKRYPCIICKSYPQNSISSPLCHNCLKDTNLEFNQLSKKEKNKLRNQVYHANKKLNNFCTKCKSTEKLPNGKTYCLACLEKVKKDKLKLKSENICLVCRKNERLDDHSMCKECLEIKRELNRERAKSESYRKTHSNAQLALYNSRKEQGLCVNCKCKLTGKDKNFIRCRKCRLHMRELYNSKPKKRVYDINKILTKDEKDYILNKEFNHNFFYSNELYLYELVNKDSEIYYQNNVTGIKVHSCIICGNNPQRTMYSAICDSCMINHNPDWYNLSKKERNRLSKQSQNINKVLNNICVNCGNKNDSNFTICEKCRNEAKETRHKLKSYGICSRCRCNEIVGNFSMCPECMEKRTLNYIERSKDEEFRKNLCNQTSKRYYNKVNKGICVSCNKPLSDYDKYHNHTRCEECRILTR